MVLISLPHFYKKLVNKIISSLIAVQMLLVFLFQLPLNATSNLTIGSKKFTESVILGEIASGLISTVHQPVLHLRELGGTRVLWNALLKGEIDLYPEYTGTIIQEILADQPGSQSTDLREILDQYLISLSLLKYAGN